MINDLNLELRMAYLYVIKTNEETNKQTKPENIFSQFLRLEI